MARSDGLETLMVGGAVAAAGVFLWANRAKFGLGTPAATSVDPFAVGSGTSAYATGGTGTALSPLVTAPIQLPSAVNTTLPANIVTNQPQLVPASGSTAGCVIGPGGGLYCPDFPAAQVLAAQSESCYPVSTQEIATCQGRKPTWTRDECVTRLTQLRAAYCAGKANLADATVANNPSGVFGWTSALQGHRTDYFNLTGVMLS